MLMQNAIQQSQAGRQRLSLYLAHSDGPLYESSHDVPLGQLQERGDASFTSNVYGKAIDPRDRLRKIHGRCWTDGRALWSVPGIRGLFPAQQFGHLIFELDREILKRDSIPFFALDIKR